MRVQCFPMSPTITVGDNNVFLSDIIPKRLLIFLVNLILFFFRFKVQVWFSQFLLSSSPVSLSILYELFP